MKSKTPAQKPSDSLLSVSPKKRFLQRPESERAAFRNAIAQSVVRDVMVDVLAEMTVTNATREQLDGAKKFAEMLLNFSELPFKPAGGYPIHTISQ